MVKTPEGTLRYSLSKSTVVVEATVTQGASGAVSFDGNDFKVDTQLVRKDATAQVSIQTAVDDSQFFTLRLEHGGSSDDSLSVEIGPDGLLRSIGVSSTSQAASIVKNVVTVAASVVATVVASALGKDPRREAAALVCEKLAGDGGTPGRCAIGAVPAAPAPATRPKPTTKAGTPVAPAKPAVATCDKRVETSLSELSMQSLYFLARSQKNRRLWAERRDAEQLLQDRICRRGELERAAERADTLDLAGAAARLAVQIELEAAARIDLQAASDELDQAVRDFQRDSGIDGPTRTEVVRMTFDLDEIPPPDVLAAAVTPVAPGRSAGMASTTVRAALKAYPRLLELYDRTGIALTLTPPPVAVRGGTVWGDDTATDNRTRIYYRPSYTAALTTYGTLRAADEQGGEQEVLRLFGVTSDDVVHPKMPLLGFAFEPAEFAERQLALAFDEKGRLVRFDQAGKSSLAGASTAAAEAVQTARDQYTETLARVVDIQTLNRRLEQNEAITKLDRLERQRALLDTRMELAGQRSTYDLVLEKRRLDAELGVILSRSAVGGEKDAASVSAEVAELRSKLDQLTREMEQLKRNAREIRPDFGK